MNQGRNHTRTPIAERLRLAGLRATRARVTIGEALESAESPLGLADLESRLAGERLPRSTVFRAVNELTAAGILNRYEFEEGFARYEIADDARGHHHHFICRGCSSVLDVDGLGELERHMGRAEASLESTQGLVVEGHRLDLFGLCPQCAKGTSNPRDPGGNHAARERRQGP